MEEYGAIIIHFGEEVKIRTCACKNSEVRGQWEKKCRESRYEFVPNITFGKKSDWQIRQVSCLVCGRGVNWYMWESYQSCLIGTLGHDQWLSWEMREKFENNVSQKRNLTNINIEITK